MPAVASIHARDLLFVLRPEPRHDFTRPKQALKQLTGLRIPLLQ
jgi:hypothetical protein